MAGVPCTFKLINAGGSLGGVVGWTPATAESHPSTADTNGQDIGYTARASYDRQSWFAVPTTSFDVESGCLTIRLTPATSTVYIAYHEPCKIVTTLSGFVALSVSLTRKACDDDHYCRRHLDTPGRDGVAAGPAVHQHDRARA